MREVGSREGVLDPKSEANLRAEMWTSGLLPSRVHSREKMGAPPAEQMTTLL